MGKRKHGSWCERGLCSATRRTIVGLFILVLLAASFTVVTQGAFANESDYEFRAIYNKRLASMTIPDSVTEIEATAFSSNELTSVTIPELVTKIGEYSFSDNQLTHLEIPASVMEIESHAFFNNNLSSVIR